MNDAPPERDAAAASAARRVVGWKHIGIGVSTGTVGAASTLFTYGSAVAHGGLAYTVGWTVFAVGAIELVRGLMLLADASDGADDDTRPDGDRG